MDELELARLKLKEQLEKPLIDENSEDYTSHALICFVRARNLDEEKNFSNAFML